MQRVRIVREVEAIIECDDGIEDSMLFTIWYQFEGNVVVGIVCEKEPLFRESQPPKYFGPLLPSFQSQQNRFIDDNALKIRQLYQRSSARLNSICN